MSGITRKPRRNQAFTGSPLLRSSGVSPELPVKGKELSNKNQNWLLSVSAA